jgi:hypothetical protein
VHAVFGKILDGQTLAALGYSWDQEQNDFTIIPVMKKDAVCTASLRSVARLRYREARGHQPKCRAITGAILRLPAEAVDYRQI